MYYALITLISSHSVNKCTQIKGWTLQMYLVWEYAAVLKKSIYFQAFYALLLGVLINMFSSLQCLNIQNMFSAMIIKDAALI